MEDQEDYTKLNERYDRPLHNRRHSAWYVWGTHLGKLVTFGPFHDESEAQHYGLNKLPTFEVIELETIDSDRANHMIRKMCFDRTSDLTKALSRSKHEGSFKD